MKLITAIIRPGQVDGVREALTGSGVLGITLSEVRGFGRQAGHTEVYRGAEYPVEFVPKLKLEVLVDDPDADRVVDVVSEAARTDKVGDGKIWIADVGTAIRIRTGERGTEAI